MKTRSMNYAAKMKSNIMNFNNSIQGIGYVQSTGEWF